MRSKHHLAFPVAVLLLSACSNVVSGTPSTDKVKADLIGQKTSCWNFDSISEFRKLEIVDKIISSEIVEYDLEIEVENPKDSSEDKIISARAIYKKQSGDWVLTNFDTKDCASTEEIAERKRLDEDALARYTDHGDGTITDKQTGLMWKKCAEGLSGNRCKVGKVLQVKWQAAIDRGKNAEFAGYSDWRIPSKDELIALVDSSFKPAIHPSPFPNSPSWAFWSASSDAGYSGAAWYVDFGIGNPYYNAKSDALRVRLVRSGQ